MSRYLMTSTDFNGEIEYRFDPAGRLNFWENRSDIRTEWVDALIKVFPFQEDRLIGLASDSNHLTLVKQDVTITFEEFWKAYAYKVGNKARAQKLWNALTATEHALIMAYLPMYDAYLAKRPRMEKLYPETFLNQRRWENELPK